MGIADCRQSSTLVRVAFCVSALCLIASAATNDDSWHNLNHVTHERYYTFMDRMSTCVTGHILSETDHSVTIKLSDATTETLDRTNILRVSVSQAAPYFPHNVQADVGRVRDIIYNDKSSWSDVKVLAPLERLHIEGQTVRIVRRGVHDIEGKLTQFSDNGLEVDRFGGRLTVSKANIAEVYYLRYRPLSDSEKYSAQEDFWYDPRLWPYYLKLVPKIPVRLFDSSLAEDNSVPRCSSKDH